MGEAVTTPSTGERIARVIDAIKCQPGYFRLTLDQDVEHLGRKDALGHLIDLVDALDGKARAQQLAVTDAHDLCRVDGCVTCPFGQLRRDGRIWCEHPTADPKHAPPHSNPLVSCPLRKGPILVELRKP